MILINGFRWVCDTEFLENWTICRIHPSQTGMSRIMMDRTEGQMRILTGAKISDLKSHHPPPTNSTDYNGKEIKFVKCTGEILDF